MQPVRAMMIIQIQLIMPKVHIFLNQIDLEAIKFLSDKNNLSSYHFSKMEAIFSNGSSNLEKIAQLL